MSANYDLLTLQSQTQEQDTKYFGFSMMVHTLLAIGALSVTVPMLDSLKKDEIVIEIVAPEIKKPQPLVKSLVVPMGKVVKATKGATAVKSPMPSAPVDSKIAEVVSCSCCMRSI